MSYGQTASSPCDRPRSLEKQAHGFLNLAWRDLLAQSHPELHNFSRNSSRTLDAHHSLALDLKVPADIDYLLCVAR